MRCYVTYIINDRRAATAVVLDYDKSEKWEVSNDGVSRYNSTVVNSGRFCNNI